MSKNHPARYLARMLCCFLLVAVFLAAANVKLYLKDGSYQLVREYQAQDDRVRFYSVDRDEWEEVPASLVDLEKTQAEIKAHADELKENLAANAAEEKAERDARKEVERIPQENGVYLIEEDKLTPMKAAESKIVTDKKRTHAQAPQPGAPGLRQSNPGAGWTARPAGTANREPEFYIRLAEDERFGIVRLADHKGNRVVEKLTIVPVSKEVIEEPDLVDTFRKQVADGLFKIWPTKPMPPGEYAVVEYTEGKVNMRVWDFFIAPGTGN